MSITHERTFFMFTSRLVTRAAAISAAVGILISGFAPSSGRHCCFLPSPAAEGFASEHSLGGVTIVETQQVEFSCKIAEWIKELLGLL